jgi:hypothetical protein
MPHPFNSFPCSRTASHKDGLSRLYNHPVVTTPVTSPFRELLHLRQFVGSNVSNYIAAGIYDETWPGRRLAYASGIKQNRGFTR